MCDPPDGTRRNRDSSVLISGSWKFEISFDPLPTVNRTLVPLIGQPACFPASALLIQISASAMIRLIRRSTPHISTLYSVLVSDMRLRPNKPFFVPLSTTSSPSTSNPTAPPCHLSVPAVWRILNSQDFIVHEQKCVMQ